jgi:PAS domain S-box-containing protein
VFRSVIHVVAPGIAQAAVFDATEEVQTEQRLAAEQRRYQMLVEQLPMVVMRNDTSGDMEYVSPQVTGMLGYAPEEFVELANSERWEEVIHPDDRARLHTSIAAFRTDQISSDEFELRLLTREGDYRNVLFRRARVDPPEGHWYLQGVAVDITELRDAEARSRNAVAALVRAGEDQQARIAVELHDDTVQVLTAILIQLERTLNVGDPGRQSLVDMLRAVIERTRRLMFELRPQLLEKEGLQPMLTEMVKNGPWGDAEVDVTISRQSEMMEALLYRTLRELILNARRHSQARSLSVTGRERGGRLRFQVADDGIGFASETALSQHPPGLHLGLTTVIERVRLAGGSVVIQSSPSNGARFTIQLPAEPRQPVSVG